MESFNLASIWRQNPMPTTPILGAETRIFIRRGIQCLSLQWDYLLYSFCLSDLFGFFGVLFTPQILDSGSEHRRSLSRQISLDIFVKARSEFNLLRHRLAVFIAQMAVGFHRQRPAVLVAQPA